MDTTFFLRRFLIMTVFQCKTLYKLKKESKKGTLTKKEKTITAPAVANRRARVGKMREHQYIGAVSAT